jgi:hypothetical protein
MRTIKTLCLTAALATFGAGALCACDDGERHKLEIESKPGKTEIEVK